MSFRTNIDIANRACQQMGVGILDPILGFNTDSLQASEIASCYEKLRVAELRRNVWIFSTRRAVLRPVGVDTMVLCAALWSSSVTYFPGAIVATEDGGVWISTAADNLNNEPGRSPLWDGYFGTMTCDAFNANTSYFAGDVVYTVATNGLPSVFLSLVNGNKDAPATPQAWLTTVRYYKDQVVTHSGTAYQSRIDLNLANTPGLAPAIWAVGTTYAAGTQVTGTDAVVYTSLAAGNLAHNPAGGANSTYWAAAGLSNPAAWAVGTTYAAGAQIVGSDGIIYASMAGGNVGHDPAADLTHTYWTNTGAYAPWTATVTNGSGGSLNWSQLTVALKKLTFAYPIGCGPVQESLTRNVFQLPANFLRQAPQNPKEGGLTFLGGPGGQQYNDWEMEGNYLVSSYGEPMIFRFVANIRSVTGMDPMFCEGLAARIGFECCERVTQSGTKKRTIGDAYELFMTEAREVNGIEAGPVEAPEDDFITVRQ